MATAAVHVEDESPSRRAVAAGLPGMTSVRPIADGQGRATRGGNGRCSRRSEKRAPEPPVAHEGTNDSSAGGVDGHGQSHTVAATAVLIPPPGRRHRRALRRSSGFRAASVWMTFSTILVALPLGSAANGRGRDHARYRPGETQRGATATTSWPTRSIGIAELGGSSRPPSTRATAISRGSRPTISMGSSRPSAKAATPRGCRPGHGPR